MGLLCVYLPPGLNRRILVTLPVHYYNTIGVNPNRRFLPHLLWTIAQISGTVGRFVLFGLIAQVYATLLASGQSLAATFFAVWDRLCRDRHGDFHAAHVQPLCPLKQK